MAGPRHRQRRRRGDTFARKDGIIKANRKPTPPATAEALLALIEASLDDDQANDVTVIPLAGKTDIADYMVIASGRSARHIDAMTDHLLLQLKRAGVADVGNEGRATKDWILIDAGDVIVHLFRPEVRAHYDLEKLWEADVAARNASETSPA